MKNIRLIRVDDRLIHGQVVTSWITQTGSKKIMIIDDELYENEFLKDVFAAAAPRGIPVEVMNVDHAVPLVCDFLAASVGSSGNG